MKVRISLKTPDCVYDAVDEHIKNMQLREDTKYDDDKLIDLDEEISKVTSIFFKYGECALIEIDTETGTAMVVPVHKW